MTSLHQVTTASLPRTASFRLLPALYAAVIFLSALLLFVVQPMFTKLILPRLGGAPAVWSVAMVFFQVALLAGYAYAHLPVRNAPLGIGALLHLGVLAAAAAICLPLAVAPGFEIPPTSAIAPWLMALLAISIGLPFAALSASAPLLQGWFAATGHTQSKNPYVLYAASNLGSFAALLAYPVLVEPFFTLQQQTKVWSFGFATFAVLVAAAGACVAQNRGFPLAISASGSVSAADRIRWAALAAVPSGLVIAVTSYITTDVAAAPFLWIVPLALYLLTFVAVFRDHPWLDHATVARLVPFIVGPLAIGLLGGDHVFWLAIVVLNLGGFFLLALLCHSELYHRRPDAGRLTQFYLWVSAGGVVGGIFAALLAPHLFNRIYEYPILILAALLVLPGTFSRGWRRVLLDRGPALVIAALLVALSATLCLRVPHGGELAFQVALVGLAGMILWQRKRPARFFGLVVLAFVASDTLQPGLTPVITARSFFGVHQVVEPLMAPIACFTMAPRCMAPNASPTLMT